MVRRIESLALWVVPLVLVSCSGGDGWEEACVSVDCGPGRCVYDGQQPACFCDEGYSPQGLTCASEVDDPCAPNPCVEQGRTRCVAEGAQATCECDEGRVNVNGACVDAGACRPNPCTAPFQTVCIPQGDAYTCVCDPGHEPTETGCNPISTFDCSVRHASGNPDSFEPDECPDNAQHLIADGVPLTGHSISPAGDVDWYRILPQAGHIYEVVVSASSNLPLYGDVYDTNAATSLGSDHRGTNRLSMRFKAPGSSPVFARIRALKGTDSGSYQVSLFDRGVDDYADDLETALEFQTGAELDGALQFDQDVDVFAFRVKPGTQHAFSVVSADGEVSVELLDGTGALKQSHQGTALDFTWRANQDRAFLRIRSASPGALIRYELVNDSLGPDDHGNSPSDATPITPGPSAVAITLEREDDLDVLSFEATAGNVYAATCTRAATGQAEALFALLDESGTVLSSERVSSYAEYVAAEAPATGKLYLRLGRSSSWGITTPATFGCKVEDLGPEDHGDTWATATPVTAGAASSFGRIEVSGDVDVFSFQAVANHVYRFNCQLGFSDCGVRFVSAGGAQVGTGNTYEMGPAGGAFFVEVRTSGSGFGPGVNYTYSLEDLGVDDHGDSVFAATTISVGAPAGSAVLESLQDKDVFSFAATAGHIYRFSCQLVGSGVRGSCTLRLLGPAGVEIASRQGSFNTGVTNLAWELPTTDTYFVEVSLSPYDAQYASYAFSLVDLGTDDRGDDAATATVITPDAQGNGTLEFAGDVDAWSFAATAGRVYKFTCARGTAPRCAFALKDATGAVLTSIAGTNNTVSTAWEATADGTLTIELGGTTQYEQVEGTYSWTLTDVGTDDHGDGPATATPVTLPMTTSQGTWESVGDVDAFSFSAVAGRIYRASCSSPATWNCRVRVKDPTGAQVGSPYGSDSSLSFLATTAGAWTVEVYTDASAVTGQYTWLLEDLGVDDHGANPAAATAVNVGEGVSGNIQYDEDADVFTFTAVPGHLYQATCAGQGTGGLSCEVEILHANGVVLDAETHSNRLEGEHRDTVRADSVVEHARTGAYTLTVTDLGVDDHGDTFQTATAIPVAGSTVSGTLEIAGDSDYFSVSLTAGTHTATATGSSAYPELTIYGTNGVTVLALNSETLTFTAPTAGTYYVKVYGWSSSYAGGPYNLIVQ